MLKLNPATVKYRGTLTGLRISSVNGTAFIDNAGATVPTYADGNHSIEIYDASGRMLKGVLKEAISAEVLGDERYTAANCIAIGSEANATTGLFTVGTLPTLESTAAGTPHNGSWHLHIISDEANEGHSDYPLTECVAGGLHYASTWGKCVSGTSTFSWYLYTNSLFLGASNTTADYAAYTKYFTVPHTDAEPKVSIYHRSGAAVSEFYTDQQSVKQVTAPGAGATIVNAKGGTVYNFANKDASFTYNAKSYLVQIRKLR